MPSPGIRIAHASELQPCPNNHHSLISAKPEIQPVQNKPFASGHGHQGWFGWFGTDTDEHETWKHPEDDLESLAFRKHRSEEGHQAIRDCNHPAVDSSESWKRQPSQAQIISSWFSSCLRLRRRPKWKDKHGKKTPALIYQNHQMQSDKPNSIAAMHQ